jgi:hypothetical protein
LRRSPEIGLWIFIFLEMLAAIRGEQGDPHASL